MNKMKVGVLISGSGSNLQALIDACAEESYPAEIVCVISNKQQAYGLERARKARIPAHFVPSKGYSQEEFEENVKRILQETAVEIVCLAGFMRILRPELTRMWEGRMLNIHPSLLPKFGGVGMYGHHVHAAVLAARETESGASVHLVTAECDEGPVLLQKSVPVRKDDTPEALAARVLEVEHEIYPQALKQLAAHLLTPSMR